MTTTVAATVAATLAAFDLSSLKNAIGEIDSRIAELQTQRQRIQAVISAVTGEGAKGKGGRAKAGERLIDKMVAYLTTNGPTHLNKLAEAVGATPDSAMATASRAYHAGILTRPAPSVYGLPAAAVTSAPEAAAAAGVAALEASTAEVAPIPAPPGTSKPKGK